MGATATLASRYETIRPIASGGMATVYLGRTVGVGGFERLVAIKKMHPHIAADSNFVEMFLDEARLAAQIRHPNVVATIDVQDGSEGLFLVMEYVEGASVTQLIRAANKQNQRLPVPIVLRIILDVLSGLQAAHELRGADGQLVHLVHRDISPPNILVGVDGVARILDFGVARAEARLSATRDGMVKGKVSYMPPEQLLGKGVDERADVYATGVVMWEMLTGRRLFVGDDPGMLLARVQRGAANSPRVLAPEVPEAIDAVCMRALKLHDERWPSASAFADALEAAAAECGTTIASARQIVPYAKSAAEAPAATTGSSSGQRALSMTPTPSHLRAAAVAKGTGVGQEVSIPIAFGETGVVPLARARGGEPEPSSSRTLLAIACLLGVAILGVAIFLAVRSPSSAGGADAPLASSSAAGASSDSTGASASGGPAPTPQPPPTAGALPATTVPSAQVQVIKRGAKPAPTWRRGPAK